MNVNDIQNVPRGKEFIFSDGTKIHNVKELADMLSTINDDVFHQYVNELKNDFCNWIINVVEDQKLAELIAEVKSRPLMYLKIRQHLLQEQNYTKSQEPIQRPKPVLERQETVQIDEVKPQIIPMPNFPEHKVYQPEKVEEVKTPQEIALSNQEIKEFEKISEKAMSFIVKEFIYGIICGIFIGLIIAQILANLGVLFS